MVEREPEFNQDLELFKLQVLSQSQTSTHFTWLAIYLGLLVSYWLFLNSKNPPLDYLTSTVAFVIGAPAVLVLIVSQFARYHGEIKDLSEYTEEVRRRNSLPPLIDLYEQNKWFWKWWRAREGQNNESEKHSKKRGFSFYFKLSLALFAVAMANFVFTKAAEAAYGNWKIFQAPELLIVLALWAIALVFGALVIWWVDSSTGVLSRMLGNP